MCKIKMYRTFNLVLMTGLLAFLWTGCDHSDRTTPLGVNGGSSTGEGGSLARFAIANDYLYAVNPDELKLFNVKNAENPVEKQQVSLGDNMETIFPMGDILFMGARDGMYIYDIEDPANPQKLSFTSHILSCDPVVADSNYAYVTLNSGRQNCARGSNRLEIYDISNLRNPERAKTQSMKSPEGLGVDGNQLFVCDDGLKVYHIDFNPNRPPELNLKYRRQINCKDVIADNGILKVIGKGGLRQYQYGASASAFQKLSQIQ